MLLLSAAALAASGWDGPHVGGPAPARKASIAAGVGASWIGGANAAGYDAGLAEHVVAEIATGRVVGFGLELDHARHLLADADAYFPAVTVPAGSLSGFRDYLVVDLGFRLGIPVGEPTGPNQVSALPWIRPAVGVAFTTTLLDAPGFDGRVALRSNTITAAPAISAGVAVRLRRWISLHPQAKLQFQVFEDVAESVGGPTRVAAEWRFQPGLDVSIDF